MSANNNITRDLPKANIQSMIFLIISYPSLLLFYLAHSIKFFYSEELKLSHENQFSIVHCIMNLKLANLFHNLSYKKWFSKNFFNLFFFWEINFFYIAGNGDQHRIDFRPTLEMLELIEEPKDALDTICSSCASTKSQVNFT